jgi:hypothetical protein
MVTKTPGSRKGKMAAVTLNFRPYKRHPLTRGVGSEQNSR